VFREAGVSNADVLKLMTTNGADLLGSERAAAIAGLAATSSPCRRSACRIRKTAQGELVIKDGEVIRRP